MSRLYDWITRGLRSAQPAAAASNKGMLYAVTDEGKLERSSGAAWETMFGGKFVNHAHFQTGAGASGTTAIPMDDSIPQNTEGDEYMTLAYTPSNALNWLKIEIVGNFRVNIQWWVTVALFQDSTVGALAAMTAFLADSAPVCFTHWMLAGTTSSTTFKVRAGRHSASGTTVFFNGDGARRMGGVMASSITITEYQP